PSIHSHSIHSQCSDFLGFHVCYVFLYLLPLQISSIDGSVKVFIWLYIMQNSVLHSTMSPMNILTDIGFGLTLSLEDKLVICLMMLKQEN
ncbi:hypothetical protein ACJX0J_034606, partial [Zea mays]